jgi:hypothetical protein
VPAESSPRKALVGAVIATLAALWMSLATGLVSSNDGSHVALARALALHGETTIDPEVGLTLWVDRARRDGHDYSDRPPGAAFAALPAVRAGAWLDAPWYAETKSRLEAGVDPSDVDALVVVRPASDRYIETYGERRLQVGGKTPNLVALQGTALAVTLHAALVGALGLWAVVALLRRRGVGPPGQLFAALALGTATLWGPYSTMLFSHVTAATAIVLLLLGLEHLRDADSPFRVAVSGGLTGLAGGWAIATDYALLLAVVPIVLASAPLRRLPAVALGGLPIVAATLAYHHAAFGSPLSIGYDHHANFEFARDRSSTFGGNPLQGAWTLFGFGHGAGLLAQSPIAFVGLVGLALTGHRRLLLALLPWALLLCFHRTPEGGAGEDHRYLVPALGPAAIGLGLLWKRFATAGDRRANAYAVAFIVLAATSAVLVWSHFFAWRG